MVQSISSCALYESAKLTVPVLSVHLAAIVARETEFTFAIIFFIQIKNN